MNDGTPPPSMEPVAAQRRQHAGLYTCLGLLLVFALVFVVLIVLTLQSKHGRILARAVQTAYHVSSQLPQCEKEMSDVRDAIERYHSHTGHYPATLGALLPDYLMNASALHCPLDTNPDPGHVSFQYFQPTASTPGSSPLLTFHVIFKVEGDPDLKPPDLEIIIARDGSITENQTTAAPS